MVSLLAAGSIALACGADVGAAPEGLRLGPSRPILRAHASPPPLEGRLVLSDEEWRRRPTPERSRVLRAPGTEPAWSDGYSNEHRRGTYPCAGSSVPRFHVRDKFDFNTGSPSFTRPTEPGRVAECRDTSHRMVRSKSGP
jgi:peptide-methionine (R)-S-oxide reductase